MATLEDKILGEKSEYYCSSSEESEGEDSDTENDEKSARVEEAPTSTTAYNQWDGSSSNTGPKGVIRDWQRFKQLETEKRAEQAAERLQLAKKLTLTCKSSLEDEKDKLKEEDPDLMELLEDDFLLEYQKQRMKEMLILASKFHFGTVINLSTEEEFLKAIDDEDKSITIVVHIYENNVPGCNAMNGCLITLAEEYPNIKFCKILGSAAGLSKHFKKQGVPALLVYKDGQVIGNFIHVTDILGIDFYSSDVENFLIEHGIISERKCVPPIIGASSTNDDSD